MSKKYLLYIDILGFSNLVIQNKSKIIIMAFKILDEICGYEMVKNFLYKAIIFSDTLLVFSQEIPNKKSEHIDQSMDLFNIAKNFQLRTLSLDISFRAIITYGQFEYLPLKNSQCFYGKSLIDAYNSEKEIKAIGIFIDNSCSMKTFPIPVVRYNNNINFLCYLNSLENAKHVDLISPYLFKDINEYIKEEVMSDIQYILEETDDLISLAWDVTFLKNIYYNSINQKNEDIKHKYISTWKLLSKRYDEELKFLVKIDFDLFKICPDYDWNYDLKLIKKNISPYL